MASFEQVPILDVHNGNFVDLWPAITLAIKMSSFIAVDTELSGLGDRKAINARNIDERYRAMSDAAKSRSIISFGISCFQLQSTDEPANYLVQTFNLTTLCSDEYMVEPDALQFLVGHGFDFNKQYTQGIPYYKGNDRLKDDVNLRPSLRRLFVEIVKSGKSVVLHNALIDLLFIHQCWYADLSPTLPSFLKDIHQIYSGGIFDTKYIAEFKARTPASYLEYIFRKLQRENEIIKLTGKRYVDVSFLKHGQDVDCVEYKNLGIDTTGEKTVSSSNVCMTYANHGWCPKGHTCKLSHNVDCVLDMETSLTSRKRKKKSRTRRRERKQAKLLADSKFDSQEETPESTNNNDENIVENITNSNSNSKLPSSEYIANRGLMDVNGENNSNNEIDDKRTELVSSIENEMTIEFQSSVCDRKTDLTTELNGNDKTKHVEVNTEEKTLESDVLNARLKQKSSGHRAGCDAFMTGFVMAVFLLHTGKKHQKHTTDQTNEYINKIYLTGKDVPLLVQESSFAKNSKNHLDKVQRLNSMEL